MPSIKNVCLTNRLEIENKIHFLSDLKSIELIFIVPTYLTFYESMIVLS